MRTNRGTTIYTSIGIGWLAGVYLLLKISGDAQILIGNVLGAILIGIIFAVFMGWQYRGIFANISLRLLFFDRAYGSTYQRSLYLIILWHVLAGVIIFLTASLLGNGSIFGIDNPENSLLSIDAGIYAGLVGVFWGFYLALAIWIELFLHRKNYFMMLLYTSLMIFWSASLSILLYDGAILFPIIVCSRILSRLFIYKFAESNIKPVLFALVVPSVATLLLLAYILRN